MSLCGVQFSIPQGVVNITQRRVTRDGRTTTLTQLEADMLAALLEANGETVETADLLRTVWKAHPSINTRAPTFTAFRIRSKIESDPTNPTILVTDHGRGFRLVVGDNPSALPERQLPASRYRDGFIGREQLLAQLEALSHHPLIVVTGPPGVGKTRLIDAFVSQGSRSAFWVDLENQSAESIFTSIEALSPAPEVVVLDGADAHGAQLSRWWKEVRGHARFQLIVTRVANPNLVDGAELAVPVLGVDEAVALFTKRMEERLLPVDSQQLTDLLEALDCLPLAVELCATRAARWSPAQQLRLLDRGLLPEDNRTGATPRNASLTSAIRHHLQHLSRTEIETLEWLASFPGGISEEDAITLGNGVQLVAIERLFAHHLVTITPESRIHVPRWIRSAILASLQPQRREQLEGQRLQWIQNVLATGQVDRDWFQAEIVNLLTIFSTETGDAKVARGIRAITGRNRLHYYAADAAFRWSGSDEDRVHRMFSFDGGLSGADGNSEGVFSEDREWFFRNVRDLSPREQTLGWMALASFLKMTGQIETASEYVRQAAAALPPNEPDLRLEVIWRQCEIASARLDADALVAGAQEASKVAQSCREQLQRLAERRLIVALIEAGQLDEALEFLHKLPKGPDPNQDVLWGRLAVLIELDRLEEADRLWQEAIRQHPHFGYRSRVRWLLLTGDLDGAEAFLEQPRPINTTNRDTSLLARAAIQRERGDPAGAAKVLEPHTHERLLLVQRQEVRIELFLALKMAGDPRAQALAEDIPQGLFPSEAARWRAMFKPERPERPTNLCFSKRWVHVQALCAGLKS